MSEPVTILTADRAFAWEHRSVQQPVTRDDWMRGDYDGLLLVRQTAAFRVAVIEGVARELERLNRPNSAGIVRALKDKEGLL
jgi:hypothetical protein